MRGGCRWEVGDDPGHHESTCERPSGILLLGGVVQVPQKFLYFPWKRAREGYIALLERLLRG